MQIRRVRLFFILPFLPLFTSTVKAQLSPPGLDGAKLVSWAAIGVNQKISNRWSTTVYVGGSSQSDPDNLSTLKKPAIFVLNQETLFQFTPNWQLALCTSLRYQFQYEDDAPYSKEDPPWKREIRYYLRMFYRYQNGPVAWSHSFRPEYRTFFEPNGKPWSSPEQFRFRLKSQANISINNAKTNFIVVANEVLAATAENSTGQWSSLQFTEDRLSTFFRHAVAKPSLFIDLGLMHQFWLDKNQQMQYTTYLSVDFLFQNPLTKIKKP